MIGRQRQLPYILQSMREYSGSHRTSPTERDKNWNTTRAALIWFIASIH